MRRSGSSSCLLRPKSVQEGDKMSVTLINTQPLPTYSTERFYMLSEIEQNAHSTTFLCDTYDCDQATQDTAESSSCSLGGDAQSQQQSSLYNILYVLWKSDQGSSPRAFCEGTLATAIQQCISVLAQDHSESSSMTNTSTSSKSPESSPARRETSTTAATTSPRLYLVVDMLAPLPNESSTTTTSSTPDHDQEQARQKRFFTVKVDTAERLARHVAQSQEFRLSVNGITVGISNHVRAAPGLEACLEALLIGARDRRRFSKNNQKSGIGMIVMNPDDLLGLQDESVTDAAQGVLQSRTCAEWCGNGNLQTFARRAHSAWCVDHNVEEEKEHSPGRTARRRRRRDGLDGEFEFTDPLLLCFMVFFVGYLLSVSYSALSGEGKAS